MQHTKLKKFVILLGLILPTVWCGANGIQVVDGHSLIIIKEAHVQSAPKGSTIRASIDGHTLTVTFTENLGQVVSLRNKTNNNNSYFCCA